MKPRLYGSRGILLDTMLSPHPHNHHQFPIYPLHFPKSCLIQKQMKNAMKFSVFVESGSRRLSDFLQTHIF